MLVGSADNALRQSVGASLDPFHPGPVGVAVSGGSDSMALLDLCFHWARERDVVLHAATVDHGLRPAARAEAAAVAQFCAARGIGHETLAWTGWDRLGNLQAAARAARFRLLGDWAVRHDLRVVSLGHSEDDQAETFLMRLAREAGIDGLSGMPAQFARGGVTWLRPLLGFSRKDLRAYLVRAGIGWADDPSNDDDGYERVRARRVLAALQPLGIAGDTLAHVAGQIDAGRQALTFYTAQAANTAVQQDRGDLLIDVARLQAQPPEIRRRLLVAGLIWIGGLPYPPRRDDIQRLIAGLDRDRRQTLAGCIIARQGPTIRLMREAHAVAGLHCPTDRIWDNRWAMDGPHHPALSIRALGAGLSECPDWRSAGLPRPALLASPAVWHGEALVAAPLAGHNAAWTARIVTDYASSLIAH